VARDPFGVVITRPWWRRVLERLPGRWLVGGPAVVAGRALLAVTGLLVLVTVPLLAPTPADWTVVLTVAAATVVLLVVSRAVPWGRLGPRGPISFPLVQMLGLAVIGAGTERVAGAYVPLFILDFVYAGLFLPQRIAYWVLPAAVPLYLLTADRLTAQTAVRTIVAACVWLLVAELLAGLRRRQRVASDLLEHDARTDPLTTIGNRRDLEDRMERLVPGDSVVVCDLDHFKQLNDTRGHAFGDQVLREFGGMLAVGLRRGDYAARFGGEEFVLLLHGSGTAVAIDVVERLRNSWRARAGATTFSAGCATLDEETGAQQALVAADAALYAAKAAGRDCTRSAEAGDGWGPRVDAITPGQTVDALFEE
jgi:diguanylate cyclase (GGDEF)-like protein